MVKTNFVRGTEHENSHLCRRRCDSSQRHQCSFRESTHGKEFHFVDMRAQAA